MSRARQAALALLGDAGIPSTPENLRTIQGVIDRTVREDGFRKSLHRIAAEALADGHPEELHAHDCACSVRRHPIPWQACPRCVEAYLRGMFPTTEAPASERM